MSVRSATREGTASVQEEPLAVATEDSIQPMKSPIPATPEIADKKELHELQLVRMMGFEGKITGGLISHPDGVHLLYALGSTIVILNMINNSQSFLRGHSNNVSCIAVNKKGDKIASGQVTYMGFKADVILWDFSSQSMMARFSLHKVKVQALAFSPNDLYLATLGGRDDGTIVMWNLEKLDSICGAPAAMQRAGCAYTVGFSREKDDVFFTVGDHTLRVWELDLDNRKIYPTDCDLGLIKRVSKCLVPSLDDTFLLTGTTSGDIVQITTSSRVLHGYGPQKHKYPLGIEALCKLESGELLAGTGKGAVALLNGESFKKIKSATVEGSVTSLSLHPSGEVCFIGTDRCRMYKMSLTDFQPELLKLSQSSAVTDVCFPANRNELFVTSGRENIHIWHTLSGNELLRITLANLTCLAVVVQPDGKAIISGWEDGKLRAFLPETGETSVNEKLVSAPHDVHLSMRAGGAASLSYYIIIYAVIIIQSGQFMEIFK
ncbi:Cilia- and flagella-associated protein 52 [Oopsacas minuta]|uniref:Cilia- and flagella-associated protein 52 n=1 Tax=Oopsacas minuta TaxID=111878 RepID=A0AAV7JKF3_9METZ|nr:Cilia- and flagella-associated protein 52 [Oopsacas minuta]